jgi:hypothetical protein
LPATRCLGQDDQVPIKPQTKDEAELAEELKAAGRRMLRRTFESLRGGTPPTATILRRLTDLLEASLFATNPTLALERVVLKAIRILPDTPTSEYPQITWRHLAHWLYDPSSGASYEERIDEVRVFCGAPRNNRNFGNMTSDMRVLLARELLDMERRVKEPRPAIHSPGYISRPALEAMFDEAADSTSRLVLIHGEPGTGKTTFAQHEARVYLRIKSSDYLPTVVADTDETLRDSLTKVITHAGRTAGSDLHVLRGQFRSLLVDDESLPIVVLDNVDSRAQLDSLVPTGPNTRVVVTSRKKLLDDSRATAIRVGHMESDEARDLVKLHVLALGDDEAVKVAEALDWRPLAIVHGCACLTNPPYSGNVQVFCAALSRNITAVLDSYGDDEEPTLTAIYKMILERLAEYPYVLDLLDITILIGPASWPASPFRQLILLAWPASASSGGTDDLELLCKSLLPEDEGQLVKALRIASAWSLIDQDADYRPMHELTRQILQFLRPDDSLHVALRTFMCLDHRLGFEDWQGGQPLPDAWPRIHLLLAAITENLLPLVDVYRADSYYLSLAIMLRDIRETGYLGGAREATRFMVATALDHEMPAPELYREALELGYLAANGDQGQDDTLLEAARRNLTDSYVNEAILASDFSPLVMDWGPDIAKEESTENTSQPEELLEHAQHAYALGVFNFELAEWKRARTFYLQSRASYYELQKTEPSFGMYAAECTRRLIELGIRCGKPGLIRRELETAYEYWIRDLKERQSDDLLLFSRFMQTFRRVQINGSLVVALGRHDETLAKGPEMSLTDQDIRDFFLDSELLVPLLETEYDRCRLDALTDPRRAIAGLESLMELCARHGRFHALMIVQLAHFKVALAELHDLHARHTILTRTLEIAEYFKETSPYWHADSLCLAYTIGALVNPETVAKRQVFNNYVKSIVNAIQRPDKLGLAEAVGHGASPVLLLAE